MSTPVIMDITVAAVLLLFTVMGLRQGFVKSLAGLVIAVIALVGAAMVAGTFAGPVSRLAAPVIQRAVAEKVDEVLIAQTGAQDVEALEGGVEDILQLLGIDADARGSIAAQAEDAVRDTGVSAVSAVIQSLAGSVIYALLFALSFVLLTLLLHVLVAAMDLLTHLPGLHALNALGGMALGLAKGALAVFLIIWVLRRFGVSFETAEAAQTHLLKFFADNTPLSALSLLR